MYTIGRTVERLIPAHAGKTHECCHSCSVLKAHPRACGENSEALTYKARESGSSPRMRGKLWNSVKDIFSNGLIPAHAGKTIMGTENPSPAAAHPRACGENFMESSGGAIGKGSSPRMRGKPSGSCQAYPGPGLIPAHAGKTQALGLPCPGCRAHPRACGENPISAWRSQPSDGSSPRMRGKQNFIRRASTEIGLIPAHAGKTLL